MYGITIHITSIGKTLDIIICFTFLIKIKRNKFSTNTWYIPVFFVKHNNTQVIMYAAKCFLSFSHWPLVWTISITSRKYHTNIKLKSVSFNIVIAFIGQIGTNATLQYAIKSNKLGAFFFFKYAKANEYVNAVITLWIKT